MIVRLFRSGSGQREETVSQIPSASEAITDDVALRAPVGPKISLGCEFSPSREMITRNRLVS